MGVLRLLLALAVVGAHTKTYLFLDGRSAVCLFYIISGFYMALILNTGYSQNNVGFYISRSLRIYVPYLIVLFGGIALYKFFGLKIPILNPSTPEGDALSLLSNFFILGQDLLYVLGETSGVFGYNPFPNSGNLSGAAFIGPGFTIAIELYFYIIAPFILRSKSRLLFGICWAALYYFVIWTYGLETIDFKYHLFPSSFIYFFAGALMYQINQDYSAKKELDAIHLFCLGIIILVLLTRMTQLFPPLFLMGMFATPMLFNVFASSKVDRQIGNLSYGVYLAHWPIREIVSSFGVEMGFNHFLITSGLSIAIAMAILYFVEMPLDKVRHKFRSES